jgi:hypothetical protein
MKKRKIHVAFPALAGCGIERLPSFAEVSPQSYPQAGPAFSTVPLRQSFSA